MKVAIALLIAAIVAGCSTTPDPSLAEPDSNLAEGEATTAAAPEPAVRVLLVGDVMAGRGLADSFAAEPDEMFAGIRHLLTAADIAGANLESPLTALPLASTNENELEADPAAAGVLASAGFDLMSLANNHSVDAGPDGLLETIDVVSAAGMRSVGVGAYLAAATAPAIITVGPLEVGFLAYDATGVGTVAGSDPGVAGWDEAEATAAVSALRDQVDVVIVSVHGGTEYLPTTDPGMAEIAEALAAAGADVVWGHGAHVTQPVFVIEGDRPTVAATSLGNFLTDQAGSDRTTGYVLEALLDDEGVAAYRVGIAAHPDRRVEFVEWLEPASDAVWLHSSWWSLTRQPQLSSSTAWALGGFRHGDLIASSRGDVTGDGSADIVASFRRPHQTTPFMELHPDVEWADSSGRSAHLGVYEPDGLDEVWVAGSVLLPVADLEVCDGAIATIHDTLDDATIVASGAWSWNGFGFDTAPDIPGSGTPGCADIDGDGTTEPVIVNRK